MSLKNLPPNQNKTVARSQISNKTCSSPEQGCLSSALGFLLRSLKLFSATGWLGSRTTHHRRIMTQIRLVSVNMMSNPLVYPLFWCTVHVQHNIMEDTPAARRFDEIQDHSLRLPAVVEMVASPCFLVFFMTHE